MARVSRALVLVSDNLFVSEDAEEADRVRGSLARAQLHRGRVALVLRRREVGGRAGPHPMYTPSSSSHGSSGQGVPRKDGRARARTYRRPPRRRPRSPGAHLPQGPEAEGGLVAIVVDRDTRLVVQGITGREGSFHATRNKGYGTNVVAGVTPGQGRRRGRRASRFSTPCGPLWRRRAPTRPWCSSRRASLQTRSTKQST